MADEKADEKSEKIKAEKIKFRESLDEPQPDCPFCQAGRPGLHIGLHKMLRKGRLTPDRRASLMRRLEQERQRTR